MNEKTIKLDKAEIIKNMWDNCQGSHVLAVAPDGSDSETHWMENNRQWDNWPEGWLTIGIPSIDPEGSGQSGEDANYLLCLLNLTEQAEALMEAEDIGPVEAVERLAPEDWEANREETADWLADAFLAACNGDGSDLNQSSPWGYAGGPYDEPIEIEPPAEFEWAAK